MLRKKQLSLILGTGAMALLANAPFAQTSSTNNQAVSPSATTSVDADTQFKAMPHSTVTVSPSATTNQTTSTNQSTSTTGVTGPTGTTGTDTNATKGGTSATGSGSMQAGSGATGTASAGSSSGSDTGSAAISGGSASSNVTTDRNPNSPGKGWAKGRDKQDENLDKRDNDQDSGKSTMRR